MVLNGSLWTVFIPTGDNESQANQTEDEYYYWEDDEEDVFQWVHVRVPLYVAYTVVFLCCFFGNLIVMVVVMVHRRMRTATNFFLANLALADFCVGVFCVYQNLLQYLTSVWALGDFLCRMYHFVHGLSCTSSILILTIISLERYVVIVHPMWGRRFITLRRLRIVLVILWLVSAVYNSPKLILFSTTQVPSWNPGEEYMTLCVNQRSFYNSDVFDLYNFGFLFVMPLMIMTYLYTSIGVKLWRSEKLHGVKVSGCFSCFRRRKKKRRFLRAYETPSFQCSLTDNVKDTPCLVSSSEVTSTSEKRAELESISEEKTELKAESAEKKLSFRLDRAGSVKKTSSENTDEEIGSKRHTSSPVPREWTKSIKMKLPFVPTSDVVSETEGQSPRAGSMRVVDRKNEAISSSPPTSTEIVNAGESELSEVAPTSDAVMEALPATLNPQFESVKVTSEEEETSEDEESKLAPTSIVRTSSFRSGSNRRNNGSIKFALNSPKTGSKILSPRVPSNLLKSVHESSLKKMLNEKFGAEDSLLVSRLNSQIGETEEHANVPDLPFRSISQRSNSQGSRCDETAVTGASVRSCASDVSQYLASASQRSQTDDATQVPGKKGKMRRKGSKVLRSRRKIIRLLIAILVTFAACNLPYHARKIWQKWGTGYSGSSTTSTFITISTTLVMYLNSGINPFLYAFLSANFRKSVRDVVLCRRHLWSTSTFSPSASNNSRFTTTSSAGPVSQGSMSSAVSNF